MSQAGAQPQRPRPKLEVIALRPDEQRALFTTEMVISFEAIIGLQSRVAMRHLGKEGSATDHHQLVASARNGDVEAVRIVQEKTIEVIGSGGSDGEQHDVALCSL